LKVKFTDLKGGWIMERKPLFIDEEIEVHFEEKPGPPSSLVWRGKEYKIISIERAHRHLDFRKPWWRRRHRDYYLVRVDTGQVFEIYFHRGPGKQYWVLFKEYPS